MKIEINLEETIAAAIENAVSPDRIGALITDQVSKSVDKAVESAFSYDSPFRNILKSAVDAMFPHELALDKQADWNNFVVNAINERLKKVNYARIEQAILPVLDQILVPAPESVKLSDLLNSIVSYWREYDGDFSGRPWLHIEESTGLTSGYKHIHIAKEKPYSMYSAPVQIRTRGDGEVWGVKFNDEEIEKQRFAGPFFNFEQQLFQLYACKTKIEFDVTSVDDVDFDDDSEYNDD